MRQHAGHDGIVGGLKPSAIEEYIKMLVEAERKKRRLRFWVAVFGCIYLVAFLLSK